MGVWIGFRRGSWLIPLMMRLVTSRWKWPLEWAKASGVLSWMHSSLVFTAPCSAPQRCNLCPLSLQKTHKSFHVLTLGVGINRLNPRVEALVDEPFDRPECWLFVLLEDILDAEALAYFHLMSGKPPNDSFANFMPRVFRCCRSSVGIQRGDANVQHGVFCSEMAMHFLQRHGGRYASMSADPRDVTPQQLFNALMSIDGLVYKQFVLDGNAARPFHMRLVNAHKLLAEDDDDERESSCCMRRRSVH